MSVTSIEQALSDGTIKPLLSRGSTESVRDRDTRLAQEAAQHSEIEAYIAAMLGPDLAAYYKDVYPQSVATGCYDYEWQAGSPYPRIEKYVHNLRSMFLQAQGDTDHLVVACIRVKVFGSEKEKEALKKLLQVDHL